MICIFIVLYCNNTIKMFKVYKLKSWIDKSKLDWDCLTLNPNAITLLEKNFDRIDWNYLSSNINAIHLIEQNFEIRSIKSFY